MKRIAWKLFDLATSLLAAIAVIVAVVTTIVFSYSSDTTPATASDYKMLEKQVEAIAAHKNLNLLLETNCNITVKDTVIAITFSNNECSLIAEYDKKLDVLSTTQNDFAEHWLLISILALLFGISLGVATFIFPLLIFALIYFLWRKLTKK